MTELVLLAAQGLPAFILYDDETGRATCRRCGATRPLPRGLGEWSLRPARSTSLPTCSRAEARQGCPTCERPRGWRPTVNEPEQQPSFLTMIGLVALVVAIVILVFFGIGYLFGRLFL